MDHRSRGFRLPIPTDEIARMIEVAGDDLQMYADLRQGQHGFAEFFVDRKERGVDIRAALPPALGKPTLDESGPRLRTRLVSLFAAEKVRETLGPPSCHALVGLPSRHNRDHSGKRLDGMASRLHLRSAADAAHQHHRADQPCWKGEYGGTAPVA
jgi:hypothetical protein